MKKFFKTLAIALTLCAVAFLVYLVFKSKNVESVEIVGQVQTLYVAGDDIDFENAKLKVTYKNGNIKMVDINSKNVDVAMFSADTVKHGTMILTYKSYKFNIDYDVVDMGAWYLSKNEATTPSGSVIKNYSEDGSDGVSKTNTMFYLHSGGAVEYYKYDGTNWFMFDGRVDKSYKYSISGDTMTIDLDGDIYELKADYQKKGYMNLVSTKLTHSSTDPDLVSKKQVMEFKPSQKFKDKDYRPVSSVTLDDTECYADANATVESGKEVVTFKRGENLDSASKRSSNEINIFIKVTYRDDFMNTIYVNVCDEMIKNYTLNTNSVTTTATPSFFEISYENSRCVIYYRVAA